MNKYIKYIPTKWIQDMVKLKESENNMCKLNLDKRLTHKPFTIFDVEECEKYIGKEGLFSDSPYDFEDIKNCGKGTLTHVATVDGFPFGSNSSDFKYFYNPHKTPHLYGVGIKAIKKNKKCLTYKYIYYIIQ